MSPIDSRQGLVTPWYRGAKTMFGIDLPLRFVSIAEVVCDVHSVKLVYLLIMRGWCAHTESKRHIREGISLGVLISMTVPDVLQGIRGYLFSRQKTPPSFIRDRSAVPPKTSYLVPFPAPSLPFTAGASAVSIAHAVLGISAPGISFSQARGSRAIMAAVLGMSSMPLAGSSARHRRLDQSESTATQSTLK